MTTVYDAGVFVAAERDNRAVWADHLVRLRMGIIPRTTAPVVAQVSRSDRQVPLRRFLRGCDVVPFEAGQGHAVGQLLARTGGSDVVDAHLVLSALPGPSTILTSDPGDIGRLVDETAAPIGVIVV